MSEYCKGCGKYNSSGLDFCRDCYELKKQGKLILTRDGWKKVPLGAIIEPDPVYQKKELLVTYNEQRYFSVIKEALPEGYQCHPQVSLSALVERSDGYYQSELNRRIDFVVVDSFSRPKIAIEINDSTHNTLKRWQRDESLKGICAEAGLPLLFITSKSYISKAEIKDTITNTLNCDEKTGHIPYVHKIITVTVPETVPAPACTAEPVKALHCEDTQANPVRDRRTVLLLAIFLGWLGMHRFYTKRTATGLLYMFSFGLFGIGWIADIVLILCGKFKDNDGKYLLDS